MWITPSTAGTWQIEARQPVFRAAAMTHFTASVSASTGREMKPPLRDAGRMARLRELYREGALEITGSDHAPYLREEKLRNGQDIWRTFDGVPGLELSLPLLVTAAEPASVSAFTGRERQNAFRPFSPRSMRRRVSSATYWFSSL